MDAALLVMDLNHPSTRRGCFLPSFHFSSFRFFPKPENDGRASPRRAQRKRAFRLSVRPVRFRLMDRSVDSPLDFGDWFGPEQRPHLNVIQFERREEDSSLVR